MAPSLFMGNRQPWLVCLGVLALGCGSSATETKPDASAPTADANGSPDVPTDMATDLPTDLGQAQVDWVAATSDSGGVDRAGPPDGGRADAPIKLDGVLDTGGNAGLDATTEAGSREAGPPLDTGVGDVFWSSVVRFCSGQGPVTGYNYCRTVKDCGPIGPIVCSLGPYNWGPSACPIPPSMQPCPAECTADKDCTATVGGKCTVFTRACPRCDGRTCSYPPPPCTSSPNSCGANQRCGADGNCEPIPCTEGTACASNYRCNASSPKADKQECEPTPCTEGYTCGSNLRCNPASSHADVNGCELIPCDAGHTCPAETRCNVGSPRADGYGCEYVPCSEGYVCPENTRCTGAAPAAGSHGCTGMTCNSDSDCDCGYCVNGGCSADPGTCQTPPV